MRTSNISLTIVFALIVLLSGLIHAEPLGTAFTYQGRLIDATNPADGLYDLKFKLFNSTIDGGQIGSDVDMAETQIDDGYFTVELNFGNVFDGNNRWLEISIRPGQEIDPYPYTILSPRQAIRPTPYTITTRGIYVDSNENVGIKTTHPNSALQVNGTIFGLGQTGCTNGDCPVPPPYTGVYGESVTGDGILGVSNIGYAGHFIGNVKTQGNMYISGNIGVNTSNPHSALQVNGTIFGLGQTGCTNGDCPVPPPYTGVYGESVTGDGILGVSNIGYAGHFIGNVNTEGNAYVSGNIGIGTTNPAEKLEIDSGDILIKGQQNFTAPGNQATLYLGDTNHFISSEYAYGFIFGTWAAPYAMVVDEWTGNVGIGTTVPAGKLDVNGSIYQRGGVLHADYVFKPGYKLESIDEHSAFMWQEKHLPAMPKIQKDENGQEIIEIGSHSRGIVEELEKAHIYIEQLNRENKELRASLTTLDARLDTMESLVTKLSPKQEGGIK